MVKAKQVAAFTLKAESGFIESEGPSFPWCFSKGNYFHPKFSGSVFFFIAGLKVRQYLCTRKSLSG
ncbi:hypothetical protein DC20_03175 [Rufibacter tibetensis]|uniref:Uncharacterized protein n=1 Tax=Rufibacter tibetensis TaxID=512763 RepID=A0A0P0C042_9BACT|nr:hypothetical protein DC20_03175 [Rufibacter tibetensis]